MKKALILFLFLIPFFAVSQQSMTASFDGKKEVIKNQDEISVSEFVLFATEGEMKAATDEAQKYSAYMTFETTLVEAGKYNCVLTFNHKGFHANVHKMLLTFGVEKFVWEGQTYSLDNWFNIIKE